MISAMIASVILVAMTLLIHYEALRLTSDWVPELRIPPRWRIVAVVFAAFAAHTVEVWVYAISYYIFVDLLHLGRFSGETDPGFFHLIYFSAVVYTSLGFGDILPLGAVRLLAGVEALAGLLMIAWSASFTYLWMEKFWPLHIRRGRHGRHRNPAKEAVPRGAGDQPHSGSSG